AARRRSAVRRAEARRTGAGAGGEAEAAAARRTGRRVESFRGGGTGAPDPPHPRRGGRPGAAGRASYESRHVDLRPGGGARLRPQDRRRHARRGAAQSRRHRRLPGDDGMTEALLETNALCAFYGATQALFGLDLAVEAGGITTLLGA